MFLLSPHPLQPKVESPDGSFGSTWGLTGPFLPEEAVDPASSGPQTHKRIAKPEAFTPDQIPLSWVFELLVYTEENLFPTLSWEVAGPQTTVSLGHGIGGVASRGIFF